MKYYKIIDSNYIVCVGIDIGNGEEITEQEYNEILDIIHNKPVAHDGIDYRLKIDLSWEEYEVETVPKTDEEAEIADYVNSLSEMGVRFGD